MLTGKFKFHTLLLLLSLSALAYSPAPKQIAPAIRMGLYENPPLEFTNEDGQADGFVVNIIETIAGQRGWQIEYVPCVWNECLAMLESGEIDLMGAIAYSSERAERFDFTGEFLITNWGQIYTRPEDANTTLLELEGKQIAALPEDIYLTGIQQTLADFHVQAEFQAEDSYEQILQAVDDGRVYAGVINHLFALQHAADYGVAQTAIIFTPIEIHFAATKGNHLDLLALIDGSLRQLKNDADSIYYQQINNWFSSNKVVFSTPVWVRNASIALIAAVLLFSGAAFFFRAEVNRKTAALQAAHQRLLTVLESIDAHVYVADIENFQILFMNQKMQNDFGQDFTGAVCYQSFRQENKACTQCPLPQLMDAQGKPSGSVSWESWNPLTQRWYINHDRAIVWVDGRLAHLQIAVDITSRVNAENALRQGEERYRIVSDLTSDYAFALKIDEDGKTSYEWVAGALAKITGISPEALSAQGGWETLVHPEDKKIIQDQFAQIMRGKAAVVEYRIFTTDGRIKWVRDYARPEMGPDKKPHRIFGAIQDITARKEAEQALKEKTGQQADLLRLARQLHATLEQTDVLTRIGRGAKEILQADGCTIYLLDPDRQLLQPVVSLDSPHDEALLATPLPLENSFTGQSVQNKRAMLFNDAAYDETGFQVPGTPVHEVEHVIAVPFLSDNTVLGAMCLNRFGEPFQESDLEAAQGFAAFAAIALANAQTLDRLRREVERRRQAEASLQETNQILASTLKELRQSQETLVRQERLAAVGQLAAGIAHDFNNIMASIILFADLLLQTSVNELSEKAVNRIQIIKQQGNRAAELTQQILDFGRKTILRREAVDLRPFLQELHRLLQRTLPESIQTTLEIGAVPCIVEADATRLQQIILNLALNARDAMPKGGHLHISSQALSLAEDAPPPLPEIKPGSWVMIAVSDDGSGIPEDILPNIFEPFFTTKTPTGSGLGLAQVFGIVDQHHGHIKVSSEVGQGTTFTIYLPNVASSLITDAEKEPETAPMASGQGDLLLVVEDDPVTRLAITQALQSLNYRVWSAANGREALTLLEKENANEISLILCDLIMPEMSGRELVAVLDANRHHPPCIIITGYPLDDSDNALHLDSVVGWLQKPVNLNTLAKTISTHIKSRQNN